MLSANGHHTFETKETAVFSELCAFCSAVSFIRRQCNSENVTCDNTFECIKELKSVVVALKTKKGKYTLKMPVHPTPAKGIMGRRGNICRRTSAYWNAEYHLLEPLTWALGQTIRVIFMFHSSISSCVAVDIHPPAKKKKLFLGSIYPILAEVSILCGVNFQAI